MGGPERTIGSIPIPTLGDWIWGVLPSGGTGPSGSWAIQGLHIPGASSLLGDAGGAVEQDRESNQVVAVVLFLFPPFPSPFVDGDEQHKAFYGPVHQPAINTLVVGDYGKERLLWARTRDLGNETGRSALRGFHPPGIEPQHFGSGARAWWLWTWLGWEDG